MTASSQFQLLDPESGRPLVADRPWSLVDGRDRWPVVAGIPYLRVGRETLRRSALDYLDQGDERSALVALLGDRDDHATGEGPDAAGLGLLVDAVEEGSATLRGAMAGLRYGPVADYFAHRWSTPTFLSGLALLGLGSKADQRHSEVLDRATPLPTSGDGFARGTSDPGSTLAGPPAVVEVACGIGHYLRELSRRGVPAFGLDVVFSKLWLASKFVAPGVPLACSDASAGLPLEAPEGPTIAFCHDALYFLADKPRVARELIRLAGSGGRVLVGHAHNRGFDHRGVAGGPLTPEGYEALFPGCVLFDDAGLARSIWSGEPAPVRTAADLAGVEAVALALTLGPAGSLPDLGLDRPAPGARLRLNPLLVDDHGLLRLEWPSPRFEAEYAAESGYLVGERTPGLLIPQAEAEADRLARLRILLDLPERW